MHRRVDAGNGSAGLEASRPMEIMRGSWVGGTRGGRRMPQSIVLELVSDAIVLPPRGNIGDGTTHVAFADAMGMP